MLIWSVSLNPEIFSSSSMTHPFMISPPWAAILWGMGYPLVSYPLPAPPPDSLGWPACNPVLLSWGRRLGSIFQVPLAASVENQAACSPSYSSGGEPTLICSGASSCSVLVQKGLKGYCRRCTLECNGLSWNPGWHSAKFIPGVNPLIWAELSQGWICPIETDNQTWWRSAKQGTF